MLCVYKITFTGAKMGNLAPDSSPGVVYVVAKDPTTAYNAAVKEFTKDWSLGPVEDFGLYDCETVAYTSAPNKTAKGIYKLIDATRTPPEVDPEDVSELDLLDSDEYDSTRTD